MPTIKSLIESNRAWASSMKNEDPSFFEKLSNQQSPAYLWIGCADSRVPSTQLTGLMPGEMFVHRNIANLVFHADLNCLSVIQYAVEVLQVEHIIVCGHYRCGGVEAALRDKHFGLIDNWLLNIQAIARRHHNIIEAAGEFSAQSARLSELNVIEQAVNVARTTVLRHAWERGQKITVNGLIYGLNDGHLHDLGLRIDSTAVIEGQYETALAQIRAKNVES